MAQSESVVTLTDENVFCTSPDGHVESIAWLDLDLVAIVTTAGGPFSADVFWVLAGERAECAIPLNAAGSHELLPKLQALPGFDNDAFVQAMSSADKQRFICWRRSSG